MTTTPEPTPEGIHTAIDQMVSSWESKLNASLVENKNLQAKLAENQGTGDEFVLGRTALAWTGSQAGSNVGCITPKASRRNYDGYINFSVPQKISGLNITKPQKVVGSGHRISDSSLVSTYSGDGGGGHFDLLDPSVKDIVFDRMEIIPEIPNDRWDGIYGHDFTLRRSVISHTVDALKISSHKCAAGTPANVLLESSWLGWLSWYKDDGYAAKRPNSHNNGSHNDGIQHICGAGSSMLGCLLQGAKYNARNPDNITLTPDGVGVVTRKGNGADLLPTVSPMQAGQAYLAQHDVKTPSPVTRLRINYNRFLNWDTGIKLESEASKMFGAGQYRRIIIEAMHNTFGGEWHDYGGTHHWYPMRFDTNCIVNGRDYKNHGGDLPNCDGHPEDDNNWEVGSGLAAGKTTPKPITYRVDKVAVAQG